MSRTVLEPEILEHGLNTGRWMVVIYDNDHTPIDDVVEILMVSTGCGTQEALIETWEAQNYGKSAVHFANRDECEIVASMISSIGVRTQVRPEWDD